MFDVKIHKDEMEHDYLVRADTREEATAIAETASGGRAVQVCAAEEWVAGTIYPDAWKEAMETGISVTSTTARHEKESGNFGWSRRRA